MNPMLLACPFEGGIDMMLRFGRGVTGAADGPAAVLAELGPARPRRELRLAPYHLPPTAATRDDPAAIQQQQALIEAAHALITTEVEQVCRAGQLPVALGGDHSLTFPLVRGVAQARPGQKLGLIYIDAHLDMRPLESHAGVNGLVSSGNSFRRLIEAGIVRGQNIVAIGIYHSSSTVFKLMAEFARAHGVTIIGDKTCDSPERVAARALRAALAGTDGLCLSVDIDAVEAGAAPGVSAPAERGLPAAFVLELAAKIAAGSPLVGADVVEVSARRNSWRELFGEPFTETEADKQAKLRQTAQLAAAVVHQILANYN